jgi:hypothetical protein
MAFDSLIDVPDKEAELLAKVVAEIQSRFSSYSGNCFYLQLRRVDNERAKITEVKIFKNKDEFGEFYWGSEYLRASIAFYYKNDHFYIYICGFRLSNVFEIWIDHSSKGHPWNPNSNPEKTKRPPMELLEAGFNDLELEVALKKVS